MKPKKTRSMPQISAKSCRLCLNPEANVALFFDDTDTKTPTDLLQLLLDCTAVIVSLEDPLPKQVCVGCEGRLRDAQQLKKQAQWSDTVLRARYGLLKTEYPVAGIEFNFISRLSYIKEIKRDADENYQGIDSACSSPSVMCKTEIKYDLPLVTPATTPKTNSKSKKPKAKKKPNKNLVRSTKAKTRRKQPTINNAKNIKTELKQTIAMSDINDEELEVSINNDNNIIESAIKVEGTSQTKSEPPQSAPADPPVKKFRKMRHQCHICHVKYSQKIMYAKHMEEEHQIPGLFLPKDHMCDVCGKLFSKPNLKSHRFTHTKEKPHSCDLCGKQFSEKSMVKRHIKSLHTKERNHKCTICGRRFYYPRGLKIHMRYHTGERPEACHLCEWKFADPNALVRHMLTHSGQRPFACKFCDKKCSVTGDLRRHVMRMHPNESVQKRDDYCIKIG